MSLRLRLLVLAVACVASGCGEGDRSAPASTAVETDLDLREAIAAERRVLASALPASQVRDLAAVYERSAGEPLWVNGAGRLGGVAREGLAIIEQAAGEGLDPEDYAARALASLAADLGDAARPSATDAARFEARLTAGLLRYFHDIHLGRVDPRTLGLQITIEADAHDFAEMLWSAINGNRLRETAAELVPSLSQYGALRSMLARYRAIAEQSGDLPPFTVTVRPGDRLADVAALHRRLIALGDLAADTPLPLSDRYDGPLPDAVARFQTRHGLDPDGILGAGTRAALQVPLDWRIRQIELSMERLRWLPDLRGRRLIAVNIPMFRLWAWNAVPSREAPDLTMAVIVGRALDTRTPVFADDMRFVVFRPYWNVPLSILRGEMLPTIRKDPDYLVREDLEIVRGQTDNAPVLEPTPEAIAELGRRDVRLRQRPGPGNALGLVKFMFPNQNNVYMHGTPAPVLFQRSRRDFSHGCIRVEDPVALAEWVLGGDPAWTPDRIEAAMNGATGNVRANLAEPIHVVIFYTTAAVMPEDGAVHFAPDVYAQDEPLADRL